MAGIHRAMMEIRNRQKKTGNKLFVRWTLFPHLKMERNLVSWLVPQLNEYLTNNRTTWGFTAGMAQPILTTTAIGVPVH